MPVFCMRAVPLLLYAILKVVPLRLISMSQRIDPLKGPEPLVLAITRTSRLERIRENAMTPPAPVD